MDEKEYSSTYSNLKFDEILSSNNLRLTNARKRIFAVLAAHHRPIKISGLIRSLAGEVDMTTVYRNIELFEKLDIINKIYTGWKYRVELSEKFRPHHHHLTCQNCGKIFPIDIGRKLESAIAKLGASQGFRPIEHELELRGLCKNCR